MNPLFYSYLVHPKSKGPLFYSNGFLIDPISDDHFPVKSGIPRFIDKSKISISDRRVAWFYDRIAAAYDATLSLGNIINLSSESHVRSSYIGQLKIPAKSTLLEIGVGTAGNRAYFPAGIFYVGLDSSINMLHKAQYNVARQGLMANLVHADAHALPLMEESFDTVICMGALQHFSRPEIAIREMWQVLAPGGKIHILDEHTRLQKKFFRLTDLLRLPNYLLPNVPESKISPVLNGDYLAITFSKSHN